VTNSRWSLRNDATRRWRILARVSSNTNCTAPMNFLWSFVRMLRQQTATRRNDFARWTVGERLIDQFLRQTALLCAPFYSAYIAHRNAITHIELKLKRTSLNQNRTRLVSTSSRRDTRILEQLVFTKSGSEYLLVRQVAYRWFV